MAVSSFVLVRVVMVISASGIPGALTVRRMVPAVVLLFRMASARPL